MAAVKAYAAALSLAASLLLVLLVLTNIRKPSLESRMGAVLLQRPQNALEKAAHALEYFLHSLPFSQLCVRTQCRCGGKQVAPGREMALWDFEQGGPTDSDDGGNNYNPVVLDDAVGIPSPSPFSLFSSCHAMPCSVQATHSSSAFMSLDAS
eukprot:571655-Rhodomonas_salina.3